MSEITYPCGCVVKTFPTGTSKAYCGVHNPYKNIAPKKLREPME
jgi:hypothetical protein